MLVVYEYCLICQNKCLIFISKQEKRTYQHVRPISVSDMFPRHNGPFWSVMFPLSLQLKFFPHTKFDIQDFVKDIVQLKENLTGKVCSTCIVICQRMEKIAGLVIEQIDVLA